MWKIVLRTAEGARGGDKCGGGEGEGEGEGDRGRGGEAALGSLKIDG